MKAYVTYVFAVQSIVGQKKKKNMLACFSTQI